MARGPAWAGAMPGKTARALCPVCQEPMPPDETECENCGAFVIDEAVVRLSRAFGIPREKALALFEKGFRHPRQIGDRNVDDVLENGENGLLFLCTNCGGFVATGDVKCPRCGAEFEEEEPKPAREERDILDLVLCPVCGADNDPSWRECEICGESLGGTEEPPGILSAPDAIQTSREEAPEAFRERQEPIPPDSLGLDRIDDALRDLETPAETKTVNRIRRVPKKPRLPKRPMPKPVPRRAIRPRARAPIRPRPVAPSATTTVRPRAARPVAPRAPRAEARPVPSASRHSARARTAGTTPPRRATGVPSQPGRPRWTVPPSELTSGVILAAAAGLYASVALSEGGLAWAIAGVVLVLILATLGVAVVRQEVRVRGVDALLLSGGAALAATAPVWPPALAPGASVGGAVLLAFATRALLVSPGRDLLAAAAGVPLVVLGVVAALGLPFAATTAWTFGLVAALPWPAAVAAEGLRERRTTAAAQREIARAEKDIARHDYVQSVKDFDRAIALGTKAPRGEELPWYGKGASLTLLGRYDEALRAIDKALDLNPHNEVAWLNKGNALTKMGRLIDALRCFNAAIRVNPTYEVAWNNKGNTLARLGHLEEALACYERALEIDPDYRGAWVNKGYVLTKLGRYDEATSCADRVLHLKEGARARTA